MSLFTVFGITLIQTARKKNEKKSYNGNKTRHVGTRSP